MWRLLSPVVFDRCSPFFVPDPGSPGGGGGNNDDDDDDLEDPPAPSSTGNAATDLVLRSYFDQSREWLRKQRKVVGRYRTRARDAEATVATERQAREGKTVIEGDDLAAFEAYKALGKPDEVKTRLEAGEQAAGEVATLKRDGTLRDAAQAAGYKFSVLKDRVTVAGNPAIEIREVEEEGKKVSRAFVTPEGGTAQELTAYAGEHWGDYLPALTASGPGQGGGGQGGGQTYPAQQGSGGQRTAPAKAGESFLARKYGARPRA